MLAARDDGHTLNTHDIHCLLQPLAQAVFDDPLAAAVELQARSKGPAPLRGALRPAWAGQKPEPPQVNELSRVYALLLTVICQAMLAL